MSDNKAPWKNGFYYNEKTSGMLFKVEGNQCSWHNFLVLDYPDSAPMMTGTWEYGDFGPAKEELVEVSGGIKNYNVQKNLGPFFQNKAILDPSGTKLYTWGMSNSLETLEWLDEERVKKLSEDRDDFREPSCPYKMQPENMGKLVWLSGPPGAGKSTTGQWMARDSGYVYYEADCTLSCLNPYVPTDVDNPTLASMSQKPLKNMSREIYDVMKDMKDVFALFESGDVENVDWEKFKPFYTCMANEIKYQHERVGGHFVVANAVTSREMRDHIRKTIPNCIFVTLTLTKETQRKRVTERHGEEGADAIIDFLTKMYQLYEGPGEGEENTFNVDITENMTREDVKQKVLEVLRPWKDGFYHNANNLGMLTKVKGNQCMWHNYLVMDYPESDPMATGTWEYGDFGPAKEEVVKASGGIKNYNMQLQMSVMMKNNAILTPDKSKVLFWGMTGSVNTLQWMSDEALKKICDEREDFREPSCPYKMQPENVGKLVWLSGPPGAGKSTTGQWMARDSGYVYYEADCTLSCLNPYVPTDVDNPTLAAFRQKPLKNMGREIFDVMKDMKDVFEMFSSGQVENIDWEKFKPFYTVMSNEIKYQHERVGGDFVVAQAVTSRDMRDHIRKQIPNCIFVTLTMTKETQLKRVTARHGKEGADAIIEFLSKIYNLYEGPGEGEKNTYNIDITAEMTREDVKQKVLELLASLEVKKKEAKKEEARKEESNPGAKKEDSKSLLAFKSDLQEDSSGCCSII